LTKVIELNAELRNEAGTSSARAARLSKKIPAILYSQNDVLRELSKSGFRTHLFDLKIGQKSQRAVVQDLQFHPVTDMPIHIDFKRVDKTSKIEIMIPVKFFNQDKSPGLKRGGTLNTVTHKINVWCTSENIPEYIHVDLAGLKGGDRVSMTSLIMPAGVSLARNGQPTVCTVIKGRGKGAAEEEEA